MKSIKLKTRDLREPYIYIPVSAIVAYRDEPATPEPDGGPCVSLNLGESQQRWFFPGTADMIRQMLEDV